ncbi:hypothetical protein [Aphanothece sacrum]|uniref:Uncharacterized protein n=1 Tax=Aphanothece sacrum FPU1 TaxID=1920663 RepID=A0A401INM8_APHSA|nr:hypothetical protein [Aphanothece sacrum]GBF82874.1 hypothetical protein AsFPU1_4308 [Aphanothece sacrum FPU1]
MSLSRTEVKQLLERLIFEETDPEDWVQDIWDLSALHGENAAKLFDVFKALLDCCSEEQLNNLLISLYQEQL